MDIIFYIEGVAGVGNTSWLGTPGTYATTLLSGNGIGTTSPAVPLDVVGQASVTASGTVSYFLAGFSSLTVDSNVGWSTSIRGSSGIVAGAVYLTASDERIKNIQGRSDSAAVLRKLLGIEITDYVFKDLVDKGSRLQKKVIVQQVEKVFPESVRKSTDVVPNIYQKAAVNNGWVELATDLKSGRPDAPDHREGPSRYS